MKGKKGQTATIITSGVIAIIVGVAMIPVLASLIDEAQVLKGGDEQLTNTGFNHTFTLSNDDIVAGTLTVLNSTCDGICTGRNGTLVDDAEFSFNERSGVLVMLNRTGTWNTSYSYEPDTYVDSATGRTVIKTVTLMYAVALIVITVSVIGINLMRQ